ncbi:MAG TPA: hypothetical protein VNV82_18075 [Bryobacteraceae bacterium]|nr:hypothetical protein [Bryobacteraceae bacterium]
MLAMEGIGQPVAEEDGVDRQEIVGDGSEWNKGTGEAFGGTAGRGVTEGMVK